MRCFGPFARFWANSGHFWAPFSTPETLQNGLRDPIEKSTKFWNPFFEFLTISGRLWGPKRLVILRWTNFFGAFLGFAARFGAEVGPRTPQDLILDDF